MAHPFELVQETTVGATPEQVWDAITRGPQIDSWFMGRTTVEPRVGGTTRLVHPAFTEESTVTAWEPPTRFAFRSEEAEDGAFHNFEYQIEGRPEATTVRWIHTGALGVNWEAEYAGLSEGDPMYFRQLIQYLTFFQGRTGVPIEAFGPNVGEGPFTWEVFRTPLGISRDPEMDQPVVLTPEGLDRIEGVTDHLSKSFFGVRTDDALYRFIVGWEGSTLVGHHLFADDVDQAKATAAWQDWITRALG